MDPDIILPYVDKLIQAKGSAEAFAKRTAAKRELVDSLREDLNADVKDELRAGFTFELTKQRSGPLRDVKKSSLDDRGSEHEVDTFGATREGYAIDEAAYVAAMNAQTKLLAITKKALAKRDADGKPVLRSRRDIMEEVYTPLVREGVLPENFVPDDYSEVKKLLKETFSSYRDTLQDEKDDKALAAATAEMNMRGAGSALERLSGLSDVIKNTINNHISEDTQRIGAIVYEGAMAVKSIVAAGQTVGKMADGSLEKAQADFLTKSDEENSAIALAERKAGFDKNVSKAEAMLGLKPGALSGVAKSLKAVADTQDSDEYGYTMAGIDLVALLGPGGKELVQDGIDLKKVSDFLNTAQHEDAAHKRALAAVRAIDVELAKAAGKANGTLAAAMSGLYERQIDTGSLKAATAPDTDGSGIIQTLAEGFVPAFEAACPTPDNKAIFKQAGQDIAKKFLSSAPNKALEDGLKADPGADNFKGVVAAVAKSVGVGMTAPFLAAVEAVAGKILAHTVFPDENDLLNEIEQSDDEMADYENQLTLIDEGGISAAEQSSIEKLIAQISKDRQVLSIVSKIGGTLESLGGQAIGIAGSATEEVTDKLIGEVMGPVKAAKLIMELAMNVKRAADRQILFKKFQKNLERSRTSVSAMSSTIQGFLNNKKEQIAFRDIEIALQIVEIAGTILGSIPEPFTMALGKTINAVNAAAQQTAKVSEMIYNEVKLAQGWKVTKLALNNPSDRALGLSALKVNPTLGMHALAWAGMEKQPPDPIARMVMDSLGLNEVTLAVSGTQSKVRQYLELVLDEDRKLVDKSKIETEWMPRSFAFNVKDWFVITTRAAREAVPALRKGDDGTVLSAMKKIADHDLKKLEEQLTAGTLDNKTVDDYILQARAAHKALDSYTPKAADGSVHDEMSAIADDFISKASEHIDALNRIWDRNAARSDPSVPTRELKGLETALQALNSAGVMKKLTRDQFEQGITQIDTKVQEFVGEDWLKSSVDAQSAIQACSAELAKSRAAMAVQAPAESPFAAAS